jgi:hypothetical protein
MRTFFIFLSLLYSFLTQCQSFEGKLTYKVDYEIITQKVGDIEVTKESLIARKKRKGTFIDTITVTLKGGNYIVEDNSESKNKTIYKVEENKIYSLTKDLDYLIVTNADKPSPYDFDSSPPSLKISDSTTNINGINCKSIKLVWEQLGENIYYFNSDTLSIDANLFEEHKFEYFDRVLKLTNAYPICISKSLNGFVTIRMSLIDTSSESINEKVFILPESELFDEGFGKINGIETRQIKR